MTDQPTPTVGRVVLYRTTNDHGNNETLPGIINRVHSDTVVDVMVMWPGPNATPSCQVSVEFSPEVEKHDADQEGDRWGWMAYQKQVHAGTQEPQQHAEPAADAQEPGEASEA